MVTEPVAPLALIRRHHRFDSRPEVIRNHTHSRHRSIVADQHAKIRETRPSPSDREKIAHGKMPNAFFRLCSCGLT